MYIVLLQYIKPLADIDALVPEHRAFLDRQYAAGHFLVSGAQVPRSGGVIIVKSMPREALETLLAEDPFQRERVATYSIIEFTPSKAAPFLAELLG